MLSNNVIVHVLQLTLYLSYFILIFNQVIFLLTKEDWMQNKW